MPSNQILEQKQALVAELAEKIRSAAACVLVKYEGITVENDTALRAALRKAGVEYSVQKNTMIGRACEVAGYPELKACLTGMTAIAISPTDPVAAAKIIQEYTEKVETFEIKAGFVDGGVLDAQGVIALAEIPSKETLIARMMGSMMSPLYAFARCVQAIIDKQGETPAEAPAEA